MSLDEDGRLRVGWCPLCGFRGSVTFDGAIHAHKQRRIRRVADRAVEYTADVACAGPRYVAERVRPW